MIRALRRNEQVGARTAFGRAPAFAPGRAASLAAPDHVVLPFPQRDRTGGEVCKEPSVGHLLRRTPLTRLEAFHAWCAGIDWAPDLAEDIGSRRWLRGLATMLGLGAAALSFLPGVSSVEAAPAFSADAAMREELRSQAIAPLAFGGDAGRHMGATPRVQSLSAVPERPTIQLVSTLGRGDSLSGMLGRAGVGAADAARVEALVGPALAGPGGAIAPGTRFDVSLGHRPEAGQSRALESLDFRARFDLDLSVERQDGALVLARRPVAVDATPLRVRGRVGSSLYRAARNAGAPVAAIQSYLQAVDKHLSFENDVSAGDEFDFVVSYRRSARGERQVGELLYAGVLRDGKPRLQLLRWGKDGEMVAAGSIGQSASAGAGIGGGQPVAGRITSSYGMRRHPILGYARMHSGIDFGAAWGTPIHAVADGSVAFAGRRGGHGNYVRLEHGGGVGTGYGHMSRIAVSGGSRVRAGQVIGYVGSTGLSTGPHLHFEAYRGGRTINPAGIRVVARPQIDEGQRAAFMGRIRQLLAVRPGAALVPLGNGAAPVSMSGAVIGAADPLREIDRTAPAQPL